MAVGMGETVSPERTGGDAQLPLPSQNVRMPAPLRGSRLRVWGAAKLRDVRLRPHIQNDSFASGNCRGW